MNSKFKDIREFRDIIDMKAKDPKRFREFQKMARENAKKSFLPKTAIIRFRSGLAKAFNEIMDSDLTELEKRAEMISILTIALATIFINVPDGDTTQAIKHFIENKKGMEGLFREFEH